MKQPMKFLKQDRFFLIFLVMLTGALSFLNFPVPFHYDDFVAILRNENIHNLFDLKAIANDPLRPQRFLQNFSFAFNWFISGSEPWSYHLVNNLLHFGNTVLLFYLLPLLGVNNRKIHLATCFLFFIHPLQVESVTYVMGRIELLKTASTLSLLILYLRNVNKWLIYLLLVCSLLIKETCILTIFLFLAADMTVLKKNLRDIKIKDHALYFSHLIFLIPVYHFLDTSSQYEHVVGFDLYPALQYIITNIHFLIYYIYLFFNPSEQSINHDWTDSPPLLNVLLGIVAYVGMFWFVFKQYHKRAVHVFMICFFLISFLPNNSILQFINPFAEYRLYQSNIVLAYFCSVAVFSGKVLSGVKQLFACLFVIFLMVFHYLHIQTWKSPVTLWGYAQATYPDSRLANYGLGGAYISEGLCYTGMKHILFACKDVANEPFWEMKCNFGIAQHYGLMSEYGRALVYLEKAKSSPRFIPGWIFYNNYLATLQAAGKEGNYNAVLEEAKRKFPKHFSEYQYSKSSVNINSASAYRCIDRDISD